MIEEVLKCEFVIKLNFNSDAFISNEQKPDLFTFESQLTSEKPIFPGKL